MPYVIDDFPIETSEPKIDVTLPLGRHVFELIVEDDAGLQSLPDRVTITVTKEVVAQPVIFELVPSWGVQGKEIEAVIHGQNLIYVRDVKFWRGGSEDTRIKVTILEENVEGGELPVKIKIQTNAALGDRRFTVTTPGGTAESPADHSFKVTGMPEIVDVRPDYARQGDETYIHIHGQRLLVEGEALSSHKVDFLYGDQIDPEVTATFSDDEESTAEMLALMVIVGRDAMLGSHRVRVTTPAGIVDSDEAFEVRGRIQK